MEGIEWKSQEVATTLKLLSHPKRLLILCSLIDGEKTVWQLEWICMISQSQLSQFLKKLKNEGMVQSKKEGLHVFYTISDIRIHWLLSYIEDHFCKNAC